MDVSPDYVFAQVGKLHVEVTALRGQVAAQAAEIQRLRNEIHRLFQSNGADPESQGDAMAVSTETAECP